MILNVTNNFLIFDYSYILKVIGERIYSKYSENFSLDTNDLKEIYKIDFSKNEFFMQLMIKEFQNTIKNIQINLYTPERNVCFALDCPRKNIWRRSYFPEYKIQRDIKAAKEEGFNLRPVFYEFRKVLNNICRDNGYHILEDSVCEADDFIYGLTNYLNKNFVNCKIRSISRDKDFFQIPNIELYDIHLEKVIPLYDVPKKNLLFKLISGDKSDGIPSCFHKVPKHKILSKGCGDKTAKLILEDKELLRQLLEEFPDSRIRFKMNKQIIDFNAIPLDIMNIINSKIEKEFPH